MSAPWLDSAALDASKLARIARTRMRAPGDEHANLIPDAAMSRDSDRHTWRDAPSESPDEAQHGSSDAIQDALAPSTRLSWLPALKLSVRRIAIKVVGGASAIEQERKPFEGGSTLRWVPWSPWTSGAPYTSTTVSSPHPSAPPPLVHANEAGLESPGSSTAAGPATELAAESGATRETAVVAILNATLMGSGPRASDAARGLPSQPSVREALATIDAAAAERSAWLQNVPPLPSSRARNADLSEDAPRAQFEALHEHDPGAPSAPPGRSSPAAPHSAAVSSNPGQPVTLAGPVPFAPRTPRSRAASSATPPPIAASAQAALPPREQIPRANIPPTAAREPIVQSRPNRAGSGCSVLLVPGTLLLACLGLAYIGGVEQSSTASGVLQVSGGPRPVLAQTSGPVLALEAQPGERVEQGQTIARIEAADQDADTSTSLQTAEVRAPVAGRLGGLQVSAGQAVSAGMVIAHIVPDGTTVSAVVFPPATDAWFWFEGFDASLDFPSLSVGELGEVPARVTHVSRKVDKKATALKTGVQEPVIRVELELLPSDQLTGVQEQLRSGERVTARLTTGGRRMVTLLFDFLRKWYESCGRAPRLRCMNYRFSRSE